MSLKHTILALLETGEITGYGIAKKFQGTFGFFWNASHQQVYQELSKLSNNGLVEFESIAQTGKPDKKVYRITETGLQELKRWIELPMDLPKIKDQLMVKLFVGHLVKPEILQTQIETHRKLHQEKLQTLSELAQESKENLSANRKLGYLALKRGIALHESWLEWATGVQQVLKEMKDSDQDFNIESILPAEDAWMYAATENTVG